MPKFLNIEFRKWLIYSNSSFYNEVIPIEWRASFPLVKHPLCTQGQHYAHPPTHIVDLRTMPKSTHGT
ncbi:hypothetical protein THF1D04_50265 [Vibrio owensii]|uniref:Uncharacterized protein n=1 Tax=Vibrio owensii TaxID=696485 RepID=A0AAU9QBP4_9VIBR|nr:hypothetical protein THF1D04_50265 [Vibrio owensii]